MAKVEKAEDQELFEQMKQLRKVLKRIGGKELLSDEEWLAGESSHTETGGAVGGVDQFVVKKKEK